MPTRTIARLATVAATLLLAGAAHAQVAWLGATVGKSWEYKPDTRPDKTWLEGDTHDLGVFLAVPLDDETYVRVAGFSLPHSTLASGEAWRGKFRAYTIGVDYFFPGSFGRAFFSGGVGQYTFKPDSSGAPGSLETSSFGWYVGVGEWFRVGRRCFVTTEIAMHRPQSHDRPTLVSAMAGLTVSF